MHEDGATPLFIACQNGHESTLQLLLNNGADSNLCLEDGTSPLYIACQNGHDITVQFLLNNGADVNLCLEDGSSLVKTEMNILHNFYSVMEQTFTFARKTAQILYI